MSKKRKIEELGMNPSTARAKLVKTILFDLVQKTNNNICYHCSESIENIDNFSIEHKEPWLGSENPVNLYFDLDNIAFSHLKCNVKNSRNKLNSETNSGYRGVYLMTDKNRNKKFRASISNNGNRENIGIFEDPIDAAKAYDKRAKEIYGNRAVLNNLWKI